MGRWKGAWEDARMWGACIDEWVTGEVCEWVDREAGRWASADGWVSGLVVLGWLPTWIMDG